MARRWFKIGAGVAAGVTTIVALFALLVINFGFDITGTDDFCRGTYDGIDPWKGPCISYINVTNPTNADVDVYNQNQISLQFSPSVPEFYLFRKDGRCRGGSSCAAPNGISLKGWNFIDFTNATKPVADKAYVYRFPAKTTKEFLLWGLKNDAQDKIKWTFITGEGELDPTWFPAEGLTKVELKNKIKTVNVTKTRSVGKDNYTAECYEQLNNESELYWVSCFNTYRVEETYEVEVVVKKWQELIINNNIINVTEELNMWCYVPKEDSTVIVCKSKSDGDGKLETEGYHDGMSYFVFPKDGGSYQFDNKRTMDKSILQVEDKSK